MSKWFDPEKSFFKLPIVRLTAVILFLGIIESALSIIDASELKLDQSYEGFNNFIEYFKFPLGILALSIPLGAIYATNHRSEQFKKQIEVANNQNNFSNYYKHIEEFEKYIDNHIKSPQVEILKPRTLHREVFDSAKNGEFTVSKKINEHLTKTASQVIEKLKRIDKNSLNTDEFRDKFREIRSLANKLLIYLEIRYSTNWGLVTRETKGEHSEYTSARNWLSTLVKHFEIADNILQFGGEYKSSEAVSCILNLNIKSMGLGVDALFENTRFLEKATSENSNLWQYLIKL